MPTYQWSFINEGVIDTKPTLDELEAVIMKSNHPKPIISKMRDCLKASGVFNYGLGLYEVKIVG